MANRLTLADLVVRLQVRDDEHLREVLRASVTASDLRVDELAAYCGISVGGLRKILGGDTNAPNGMTLLRLMAVLPGFAEQIGFKALGRAGREAGVA